MGPPPCRLRSALARGARPFPNELLQSAYRAEGVTLGGCWETSVLRTKRTVILRERHAEPSGTQELTRDRRTFFPPPSGQMRGMKPASRFCRQGPSVGARGLCMSRLWSGASLRMTGTIRGCSTPERGARIVLSGTHSSLCADRRICRMGPRSRRLRSARARRPPVSERDSSVGAPEVRALPQPRGGRLPQNDIDRPSTSTSGRRRRSRAAKARIVQPRLDAQVAERQVEVRRAVHGDADGGGPADALRL